jgi:FMN phosphatase YigB (HAD superfamily)
MTEMYVIVVFDAGDALVDVVGPFWDQGSADAFARRNMRRHDYRWEVTTMRERGEWLADAEHRLRKGKR